MVRKREIRPYQATGWYRKQQNCSISASNCCCIYLQIREVLCRKFSWSWNKKWDKTLYVRVQWQAFLSYSVLNRSYWQIDQPFRQSPQSRHVITRLGNRQDVIKNADKQTKWVTIVSFRVLARSSVRQNHLAIRRSTIQSIVKAARKSNTVLLYSSRLLSRLVMCGSPDSVW
jgi:hypothetical protein